jgi:hypothetical protein
MGEKIFGESSENGILEKPDENHIAGLVLAPRSICRKASGGVIFLKTHNLFAIDKGS